MVSATASRRRDTDARELGRLPEAWRDEDDTLQSRPSNEGSVPAGAPVTPAPRPVWRLRRFGRAILARASSSLTRRIVVLNLAGLVALFIGFLTLNQFRQGLIEARVQSLLIQGEIIAGAIAASATVETDSITMDPDRLLQMQAGETPGTTEEAPSPLEFSINPERVAPLLRRLVTPTR